MSVSPISRLPQQERQKFLTDLNYLNTGEIKSFCKKHSIPYAIAVEAKDGCRRKPNEDDRRGVILDRIRHFLQTGVVLPETCFSATVVSFEALPENLKADDRMFYGQYDKRNRSMIALLKQLTKGRFRDGAIARILVRQFWSRGKAPTFKEYAFAWLQAVGRHAQPNSEWAFLYDRARGTAGTKWKKLRAKKAMKVIKMLNQITSR